MKAGEYRANVKLWVEEGWNKGNFDIVEQIFHPDYVQRDFSSPDHRLGYARLKRFVTHYRKAFPDLRLTVDEITVAGNKVVWQFTARGTHRGLLFGIKPSGKQIEVTGVVIFKFDNNRVRECQAYWNSLSLFQQVGVDLPTREVKTKLTP